MLGATNVTSMNRQTTHLVTDRTDGQKVEKAREWGLEIISQEWLLDMGRTGMLQLPNAYRLKLSQGKQSYFLSLQIPSVSTRYDL